MKIKNFSICFKNRVKPFNFKQFVLIHSDKNSTGKTTLIRSLLYTFGFSAPSTSEVNFNNYSFLMEIENGDNILKICREKKKITINDVDYFLPSQRNEVLEIIFGVSNKLVLENFLNIFYIDQDDGWSIINKGNIFGDNKFDLLDVLSGFDDFDDDGLKKDILEIESQIKKYEFMTRLVDKKSEIEHSYEGKVLIDSSLESLNKDATIIRNKIKLIKEKIENINRSINENNKFSTYIARMNLAVKQDDIIIPVNENTLLDFEDIKYLQNERKQILNEELASLTNKLNSIQDKIYIKNSYKDINQVVDDCLTNIQEIDLSQLNSAISSLKAIKNAKEGALQELSNRTNVWVDFFWEKVLFFSNELKLPDYLFKNNNLMYMKRRRKTSGAILHKLSLCFKMSLLKTFEERYGIKLPFIIDSPGGREFIDTSFIDSLEKIKNNFGDYQIIIATIKDIDNLFPDNFSLNVNKTLFDFPADLNKELVNGDTNYIE